MNELMVKIVKQFQNPEIGVEGVDAYYNAYIGLIGELGELAELMKKHYFQGHPLIQEEVDKELADIHFYYNLLLLSTKEANKWVAEDVTPIEPFLTHITDVLEDITQESYGSLQYSLNGLQNYCTRKTIDELVEILKEKLSKRYNKGEFDSDDSIDRED